MKKRDAKINCPVVNIFFIFSKNNLKSDNNEEKAKCR